MSLVKCSDLLYNIMLKKSGIPENEMVAVQKADYNM